MILLCPLPPSDLCRTHTFLVSFVFPSQYILALVIYYKWPYCLIKAGVSIIEGRVQARSHLQKPNAQPCWWLLGFQLMGSKCRLPKMDLQIASLQGSGLAIRRGHWGNIPTIAMLKIIIRTHKYQLSSENAPVSKVCFNRNISIMYCSLLQIGGNFLLTLSELN